MAGHRWNVPALVHIVADARVVQYAPHASVNAVAAPAFVAASTAFLIRPKPKIQPLTPSIQLEMNIATFLQIWTRMKTALQLETVIKFIFTS